MLLNSLQNLNSSVSNLPLHKLLPQFAHTMMMRDRPSIFHDLLPCCIFNLGITLHRIFNPLVSETKIHIYCSSRIINLRNSKRNERFLLHSSFLTFFHNPSLDILTNTRHIFPSNGSLKGFSYKLKLHSEIS